MAKLTDEKVLDYLDSLSLEAQTTLLAVVKQRVIQNLSTAQSKAEEQASELQSKINQISGSY